MKKLSLQSSSGIIGKFILFAFMVLFSIQSLLAGVITGILQDASNQQPISLANVALFDSSATVLMLGTSGNYDGNFLLENVVPGKYKMRVSAVGYQSSVTEIEIAQGENIYLGILYLLPAEYQLDGVTVEAQRIRAQTQTGKTSFLVNNNMQSATHTGADILKLIPGIQLDIRQNISLEGSQNIIVLVNGRERDQGFVSQLIASQIDKIEVINNPPAQYDASVTGVINIVLKQNINSGIHGHVYGEIPLSSNETFIFPSYNLTYGVGKFTLFTSYNGEMSYFDIEENIHRKYENGNGMQEIISQHFVNQENWSHRFHYGFDYYVNKKNQLSFYAFYNPYSQEHSGRVELFKSGESPMQWSVFKDDDDRNTSGFYSLYYKHIFCKDSGHDLVLDASIYTMNGKNSIRYFNDDTGYDHTNHINSLQRTLRFKADYSLPVSETLHLTAGMQARQRNMSDADVGQYYSKNQILAAHGAVAYKNGKVNILGGLRYENAQLMMSGQSTELISQWMPNLAIHYKYSTAQSLKLTWRSGINYPGFYQLTPSSRIEDPYTINYGNPGLKPGTNDQKELEYSYRFSNHFVSARLFYNQMKNAINHLTIMNEDGIFESSRNNLGDIVHYGLQFSGAFGLGKRGGFQPYLKVFQAQSLPNSLARAHGMVHRRQIAFASGFSAFANLGREFTASLIFQYSSPLNEMQQNYFEGAQFFVSLEKNIGRGFKVGMVSAVPFTGQITYHGSKINGADFTSHSQGDIILSMVPLWLKLSYQFSSGTDRERIVRQPDAPESKQKKGF